jgi:hypothetical protein
MLVAWIALGVSTATSIFWIGYYFGALRGRVERMRIRLRDLERAYEQLGERKFRTRFPQDDEK